MPAIAAYVVAISTLLSCGLTAVILIRAVSHLDPQAPVNAPKGDQEKVAV